MSASAATVQNSNETLVGAIVIALAVIVGTFLYFRPGAGASSGYELQAHLARVDGISVGTDVRLAGIKIGSVSDVTLDPNTYLVTVHLNIRNDVKIPEDSSLISTQVGVLGGSYLSITPGGDDKVLPPGGTITNTQGSVDLMGLIGRAIGGSGGSSSPPQTQSPPQPLPSGP
jgi:phospholipid/cholesterol/gamma-HCH transport system substrate-binding protein